MKTETNTHISEQVESLRKLLHSKTSEQLLAEMTPKQRKLALEFKKLAQELRMNDKEIQALLDEARSE